MAIRVKKRYDARQNVAGAWGLGLEAWGLGLFFIIPDPWSIGKLRNEVNLLLPMDQGSVQSGILKISLQILSPATVQDAVTSDLIPDPSPSFPIARYGLKTSECI